MRASQRELDAHVRAATQRLEQARQAGRIERAARAYRQQRRPGPGGKEEEEEGVVEVGAELRELVGRWRDASRAAAEELFGFVRARVEGMGGARAWRESRRWQWQGGFGRDEVEGVSSREGGEGEGVEEEEEGLNGEEEVSSRQRGEMNSQADTFSHLFFSSRAQGFTMLMMLKSLNIDPDVLGYDAVEDKWRDWGRDCCRLHKDGTS